jgi:hypothetical protein
MISVAPFDEQQSFLFPCSPENIHCHHQAHFYLLLSFLLPPMALAPKLLSSPADPLSLLQHARLTLVNNLPPNHDLRKRVQPNGHGELLPEQPAGRPRALLKAPSARKRGREPGDPTVVLERHQLMTMWNEKHHLKEWDRVRDKMSEHRKRLGMRERPYKEDDSCGRSRQDSSDKSCYKERKRAARESTKKRRKNDSDTLAARNEGPGAEPGNNKRRRPDSRCVESEKSQPASASGRDADTPKQSGQSLAGAVNSDKEPPLEKGQGYTSLWTGDWNLSRSPLRTLDEIVDHPDSPIADKDAAAGPLFPTVAEALKAIPASGISMRRIIELFWDRVSSNMDDFHIPLHDNTHIDVDKTLIWRKRTACEEGRWQCLW